MSPGYVVIKIGNDLLGLPRSDSAASHGFPLIRELLRLLSVCLFRASLDAPAVGEGNASEAKFRAFSLSNAGHTDNHTDNIRACPTMFLVVRLRGKQRFCLGVLAKQRFNSPRLHVNGKNSSQNRKLTTG